MTLRLNPQGPALSRIILGTSTFAREIGQEDAERLMDGALERGITLIDTAATYSAGKSESLVGGWLKSRRLGPETMSVATKIYPPYTAAAIDRATGDSARRLGVDTIDLLYLHKWDPTADTAECARALHALVQSGRVRCLGASNFDTPQLQRLLERQEAEGLSKIAVVQNNNNLALRDVDATLRALCTRHHVAIVTYSPLGAGFLTGKHRNGVAPGSRFDVAPGHQEMYFQPLQTRRLDLLASVAQRLQLPMPHLALAWALHHPGVAAVLVGGREPRHLDQALAALAYNNPSVFADLTQI